MAVLLNNNISTNQNEIVLKHNRGVELSGGTDVVTWSSIETGWVFKQETEANRPTYNDTEKAIEFNVDITQYLRANKSFDYSQNFIFDGYIKLKQTGYTMVFIWQYDDPYTNNYIDLLYFSLGYFKVGVLGQVVRYQQAFAIIPDYWYHILIQYDSVSYTLFVDGKFYACYELAPSGYATEMPLEIGRSSTPSQRPDCYISQISIKNGYKDIFSGWNGSSLNYSGGEQVFTPPLRMGTIVPILDLKSELYKNQNILYTTGNYVYQWKDEDDNMALQHEIGYQPIYNLTNGLTFDGVNDFMSITHNDNFNLGTNDFTIITKFYIKSSAKLDYISLLSKKLNNNNLGWYLYFRNQNDVDRYKLGFGYSGETYTDILSSELAYLDTWHEVLVQGDSLYLSIFVNGYYAGNINREKIYDSTTNLLIGKHDSTNVRLLNGYIDEISIFPYYRYDISGLTEGDFVYEPSLRQSAVAPPPNSITFITNKFGNFEPVITTNDASIGTWQVFGVGTQTSNNPSFTLNGVDRTVSLTIADYTRLTSIIWDDEAIKGTLDISYLTALQDTIKLNDNPTLSTIIWPTLSQNITTFWLNGCAFEELNLSSLTTIRGDLRLCNNPDLSSITLPPITASVIRFDLDNCNFTTINIGNLQNLSGILQIHENNNLVGITLPSSSNLFSLFSAYNCNFTSLNLSNLTNLGGQLLLSGNTSLSTLTMPTYSAVFTEIDLSYTSLGVISWENFTADNSNILIKVNDCSLTQDEVNETLVKLDTEGWTGGTLYIDGNNAGPDVVSGGFDGVAAKISLSGKSWNIYINPDRILFEFTTNKTGSITPEIQTTSDTSNWYLNDEYYQTNSPSFTGLTGVELDGIMELDDYSVVTYIDVNSDDLINQLDFSLLTNTSQYRFYSNSNLTGVTFPITNTTITYLYGYSCNLTGTLDLSTLTGLGGDIKLYSNPNLTEIINPVSSGLITFYYAYSCNLTGTLDLSGLTGLGGSFSVYLNANLTEIINPVSSKTFTIYYAFSCNLTGTLDLSGLTGLGGNFRVYSNANLTEIINPVSNRLITYYYAFSCNLTGTLDLSGLTGLGGQLSVRSNPNLTQIINPVSSKTFTIYSAYSCNLTGTLDLSGLTGLGGSFYAYSNPNLTDIIFPYTENSFTSIMAYSCNLGLLNWEVLATGDTSNYVDIQLQDNNMTTTEVNGNLAKLNETGWLSGICYIDGTNAGIDTISGGFNGVQAKIDLEEKGWTVYTNAEIPTLILYTTKTGTYSPYITTGTTNTATWFLQGYNSQITNNPSFTGLTGQFLYSAIQISDFSYITGLTANNQNISGTLDLSLLTNLSLFDFGNNNQLNRVIYPNDTQQITLFDFSYCNLYGDLDISSNTTGIINLSGLTGLSGDIRFISNNNVIDIIFPVSSELITNLNLSQCDFTNLNLSNLSNLSGDINLFGNESLSGLTLPSTTQTITSIDLSYCDLGIINWEILSSGSTNDDIIISMQNNNMLSEEVNETLTKLDILEWSGGTLNLGGNNNPIDSFSGGYDGIIAYNNLLTKNWTITVNTVLSFTTNKVGTFSPSIVISGSSISTWGLSGYTSQTGSTASFTGLTGDELNGSLYINAFPTITEIDLYNENIINTLDIIKLTDTTIFNLSFNSGLTNINNPSNNQSIEIYYANDCNLEILDLSSLIKLGGDVRLHNNYTLSGITFPSSSEAFTNLHLDNCDFRLLDLSNLTGLGGSVILTGNTNLTGVTFPSSSEAFTYLYLNDVDINSTLFLNDLNGLAGDIRLQNNSNMTAVIFPESSGVTTNLYIDNCDLTGLLYLDGMTGLAGDIRLYNNLNLTEIIFPISSSVITNLYAYSCDLTGTLDLSTMTGLGGLIRFNNNINLNSVIFPISNETTQNLYAYGCDLTGNIDLSTMTGLGGAVYFHNNTNLTGITFPTSSQSLSLLSLYNCNLTGTIDLSGLTGLLSAFRCYNNPLLTDINLPVVTAAFTTFDAYSCDLGVIQWYRLSGGTSNNINIQLQDNNMISAEVNENLYLLDQTGWLNGTCTINGNNEGADTNSGGFNGLAARDNLVAKGWTITINAPNESEILTMTWNVPSGTSVSIPQLNGYNYDYYIDWGDGSSEEHITTYDGTSHNYTESGLTEIKIVGTCETLYFNNIATERTYVSGITHWGNTQLKIVNFYGCSNLATLPSGTTEEAKLTEVTTFTNLFRDCYALTEIPNLIFSGCTIPTDFSYLIRNSAISSLPSGLLDDCVSATNFYYALSNSSLTTILSGLFDNCPLINNVASLFHDGSSFTTIPSGLFDNCPLITNFSFTFYNTAIDWIPSGLFDNNPLVTTFYNTFTSCNALTGITEGLFNNNVNVQSFGSTFYGNIGILSIPDGLFDYCTGVTTFASTFQSCGGLTNIPSGLFDNCPLVNTFDSTFYYANGITSIPTNLFDNNPLVTTFVATFFYLPLTSIPTGLFNNNPLVENFGSTFYECPLTSIPSGLFDNCSGVTTFAATFYGTNISIIPTDLFNSQTGVTTFESTFQDSNLLTTIPSDLFDTNLNVDTFYRTFYSCAIVSGDAPDLWITHSGATGTECFATDIELYNYEFIPTDWGGLGYEVAVSYTTNAPSTFTPSVTSIQTVNWSLSGFSDQLTNNANFTGLSGATLYGELSNSNITGITTIDMADEYLVGNVNLVGLTNVTDFVFYGNSELTGLTFPSTNVVITNIQLSGCSLGVLNWEDLSGQTCDDIIINMDDNNMTTAEVNETLVLLDQTTWTGGTISLSGANDGYDSGTGGFDGTTAIANLLGKGWNATINLAHVVEMGYWNDDGFWVDTSPWLDDTYDLIEEYRTVYNSMTTKPSESVTLAQNTLVESLVNAGVWDKLDVFYNFANEINTAGEAQINWKTPGTRNATLVNSPIFTSLAGFSTNGSSSYINTNYTPSTHRVNYSLNSASMFVYPTTVTEPLTQSMYDIGVLGGPSSGYISANFYSDNMARVELNTNVDWTVSSSQYTGFFVLNRTASNSTTLYRNKTSLGSTSAASADYPATTLYVGCLHHYFSGATSFARKRYAFAGAGASLSVDEITVLTDACNTYLSST